jgi:phospholipid/cholesterol/gamma-HCH transport system permease protein
MDGWVYGGFTSSAEFIDGAQRLYPFPYCICFYQNFHIRLLLATIPSFHGYYMKGGALEVGKASTVAFMDISLHYTFNYILTQLLLGS